MKNNLKYILVFFFLISIIACQEEGREDLIDKSGNNPGLINNIEITPTPGGGIVNYDIPDDENFLYAKAVYEAPVGVPREAKSSKYDNELILEGFGDTDTHNIKFYSVGRNTKESSAIEQSFNPLTPSIFEVAETIDINAVFGGFEILYDNLSEANIIVEALIDTIGTATEYVPYDKLYTKLINGRWVIRGFEAVEINVAVKISDPFGNQTDLIKETVTPLFEIEIPKDAFADLKLPTDSRTLRSKNPMSDLWDDVINSNSNFWSPIRTKILCLNGFL
ncbi:DUF4959 domain-containing protein [Thalassobellus suaedae]|uniref:DUF4959 domain-containing protein n=1 Tax=Thalassobellus suaedae TaxID=3074124 RepID=A0ABY9XYL7_9FLAO|nr:DUF4959 domain-containing protein [Flavobacteriaceae bacterium HL-DH14]